MKADRLGADFWKFWFGQTISNLGSSITNFALPLLVYKLTGSALNLGLAVAFDMAPYLLFGLVIGALVDRLDRKMMMILTDILRTLVISVIPLTAAFGHLNVWVIYAVGFIQSTLSIFFDGGEFAAIPSLVSESDLVTANGRIQASYSAAQIGGPVLAGAAIAFIPVSQFLLADATSFLLSALSLVSIRRSFNAASAGKSVGTIRKDVVEGLRYVLGHPILRNISLMMALVNFVSASTFAQLVLFSKQRLGATDSKVGLLFAAGSIGVVVLSLSAGALRRRWSFSRVALGALSTGGVLLIAFAFNRSFAVALVLWAIISGLGILFNINTGSLRQAIVPSHLLGRVISIASVIAWSAIPLGAILGGYLIKVTHKVVLIYAVMGVLTTMIPLAFALTPLGKADKYLQPKDSPDTDAEDALPAQ